MFRFEVTAVPNRSPACCKNCGAGMDRDWWLDFNYIEDFYGSVFLCDKCCDELATVIQYRPAAEFEAKIARITADSKSKDVYVSIYNRLFGPGVSPELVLELLSMQTVGEVQERVAKQLADGENRVPKQVASKGPIRVSNDAGSNLGLTFE